MRIKKVEINADVEDVLRRSKIEGLTLTLPEQLERPLYTATDKVLKALGIKWNRGKACHLLPSEEAAAELEAALEGGSVVDRKKTLELFETPPELAKRMGQIAAQVSDLIDRNVIVLEPSAGTGRLLEGFREHLEKNGGDTIIAEITMVKARRGMGWVKATAHVGETLVCEASLAFAVIARDAVAKARPL